MSFAFHNRAIPLVLALAVLTAAIGCGSETTTPAASDPATETFAPSLGVDLASMTKVSQDLYTKDLTVGTGAVVASDDSLTATYTGWLTNGTQFDSNVGGVPIPFRLGVGRVIRGWDEGLVGMRVGGERLLVIGSALAYGAEGRATIPPNATLVFRVRVLTAQ